jgi:hypothetical protein
MVSRYEGDRMLGYKFWVPECQGSRVSQYKGDRVLGYKVWVPSRVPGCCSGR